MPTKPQVVVVGAGAVGGYFAARLADAGWPVTVVAGAATADRVRRHGLSVRSVHGDFVAQVNVAPDVGAAGPADLVLVAVKAQRTRDVARGLAGLQGSGATVMSLQGGMDNEALLARTVGWHAVLPAVVHIAAEREAPGMVRHRAAGTLALGESSGQVSARVERLAGALLEAGVPCTVSGDVWRDKWARMVWAVAYEPFTVLTRSTLERVAGDPEATVVTGAAMAEACTVAEAEGFDLGPEALDEARRLTRSLGQVRTPMLQDFEAGRPLELDALTGAIVRRGRRHGVSVPTLEALYATTRLLAAGRGRDA